MKRFEKIKNTLETHDQAHLLTFYDELDSAAQENLLDQLEAQDWAQLSALIESHVLNEPDVDLPEDVKPAPYYPREPGSDQEETYREARALGEKLIREGKVAAFMVAGGQGTRLGWDGPKGTYPATPVEGKTLFQVFAEQLRKTGQKYGVTPPWYLMTSDLNDADTRAFFEDNDFFGLDKKDVMFFKQGTMPSIGLDGKVLLADKGHLFVNPDGHGGSLKALYKSGALEDMQKRGVEQISYFQVDNPNVKCVDPLFIGLHAQQNAEMSAKMLPKVGPFEKVGNFALVEGRTSIIEYSDIPDELAKQRDEAGNLRFNAGSIAIHVLSLDFVKRLNEGEKGFALPYHRAEKKVPHLEIETGEQVEPDSPNAVKLELFVFDALPLADETVILETERVEEFAPIKNAEGDDSPKTSKELQSQRAARWLQRCGVDVPMNEDGTVRARLELSPLTAVEPADLEEIELPNSVAPGTDKVL